MLYPGLQKSIDRSEKVLLDRNRDKVPSGDGQYYLQPLGMGSIHHASPLAVILFTMLYHLQVHSVQHRAQYLSVIAVEALSQKPC
jgi:hypothetical protein